MRPASRQPVANARRLRRAMTGAERRLWARLRNAQLLGHKFRRQMPVGRFIADFACEQAKLIVEVDGGQHGARVASDAARTAFLEEAGYLVIRFWNHEVLKDTDGVVGRIAEVLMGCRRGSGEDPVRRGASAHRPIGEVASPRALHLQVAFPHRPIGQVASPHPSVLSVSGASHPATPRPEALSRWEREAAAWGRGNAAGLATGRGGNATHLPATGNRQDGEEHEWLSC